VSPDRQIQPTGRHGIGRQLTQYALGVAILLGILLIVARVAIDVSVEKTYMQQAAEGILNTVSPPAARAAFQLNEDLGREVLAGLKAHELVLRAEILDDEGHRLAAISRPPRNAGYAGISDRFFADIASYAVALENDYSAEPVGRMTLDLDPTVVTADVVERAMATLIAGVIWSAAFTGVLLFVFNAKLARPLRALAERSSEKAADPADADDLVVPAGHERDELGILVETINRYVDRLRHMRHGLRLHEEQFKRLFENAEISIWNEDLSAICDRLGQLRREGVEDLCGYLAENEYVAWELAQLVKVVHVNEATLKLFRADNEAEFLEGIDKTFGPNAIEVFIDELCAIWNGEKTFRAEAAFRTLDGRDLTAIVSIRIPETEEGFRSVPVSIIDITDRKAMEQQLLHAQKMEAIGQLTGGLAHDLNNVLTIISVNVGILSRRLADNPEVAKHLDAASVGVTRAGDLTRKLLDFSRTEPDETQRVSVNEFVRGMEGLIAKSLTPAISFDLNLSADAWVVDIDPGELESALLNLALNARDAMADGGALIIETANKVIDDNYVMRNPGSSAGEFVLISVSDTGTGMDPDLIGKVFMPFFTTKDVGKGTGLGLSMVYGFVQRSGGHVKIYSEPGQGTTVRLYLPRAHGSAEADYQPPLDADHLPGGNETVLIVDDEEQLVDAAVMSLEALGYTTLTAFSGVQALDVIDRRTPSIDLLFTDVIMPGGVDGYQLAMAALAQRPGIKVLMTSGFTARREEFVKGENAIALELTKTLLDKPYNIAELAQAVRRTLDRQD
jgi:signal transduction histidine kinase/CheY-like chemotaxis protein